MLTEKLKVGDYIFTAYGKLCRITKVNKQTYTYEEITSIWRCGNVAFNGIKHDGYGEHEEFFYCDNAQAKALELAIQNHKKVEKNEALIEQMKETVGMAKYLLNLLDIEEVEVE